MTSKKWQAGFTLLELLIVISVVIILAIIAIALLNPQEQISKVYDVQRKRDLNQITRIFEEYYTDNEIYPVQADVCIDSPTNANGICSCHMCGLSSGNSKLKSYASKMFCDPSNPKKRYLYQYDCSNTPQWYSVCASLDKPDSQTNALVYNYGVASTNRDIDSCYSYDLETPEIPPTSPTPTQFIMPTNIPTSAPSSTPYLSPTPWPTGIPLPQCAPDPVSKWCIKSGCNNCGTFEQCQDTQVVRCDQPVEHLYDANCNQECSF